MRRKPNEPEHEGRNQRQFAWLKGTAKEKAGQVTNNPSLIAKGQNERFAGKVQSKVGQIEAVLEK
jgi:uncharacterized protein YjbJ (UPF0337 family)